MPGLLLFTRHQASQHGLRYMRHIADSHVPARFVATAALQEVSQRKHCAVSTGTFCRKNRIKKLGFFSCSICRRSSPFQLHTTATATATATVACFKIMACSAALASTSTTYSRASSCRSQHAPVVAKASAGLVASRLPSCSRSVSAKAYSNCGNARMYGTWSPVIGACGPSYNQRWRGSGQRSFEKWAEQVSRNMWFPVDVEETAEVYTFVADVPGLGKDDIKV